MNRRDVVLEAKNIAYAYKTPQGPLPILKDIHLTLRRGEFVALTAPSGAGKSTLLNLLGLLEISDHGHLWLYGPEGLRPVQNLSDIKRTELRCHSLGFIHQSHQLLPEFNALENVAIPQMIAGVPQSQGLAKAKLWLEKVGLGERLTHKPNQLSGGQQQRVAIARALINGPCLILADEPTGNLDHQTTRDIFSLLSQVKHTCSILMATHNRDLLPSFDRVLSLQEGHLVTICP